MFPRIMSLLIGYCFGLFQTSYIYGKLHGIDIRTKGSGNAGTTNTLRTFGAKAGFAVGVCDIVKCILAVYVVWLVFHGRYGGIDYLLRTYAGLGCIIGHNYPFYMGFHGGKGVACTAGFIMSISWQMTLIGFPLFFSITCLTHYVSLASLAVGAELMAGTVIMGQLGLFGMRGGPQIEMYVLVAIIVGQMYYRHHGNIARLIHGTERKTYFFNRKEKA